jgi:hypothetical protein
MDYMTILWILLVLFAMFVVFVDLVWNGETRPEKVDRDKIKSVEEIYEDKWY